MKTFKQFIAEAQVFDKFHVDNFKNYLDPAFKKNVHIKDNNREPKQKGNKYLTWHIEDDKGNRYGSYHGFNDAVKHRDYHNSKVQ